MKYFINHKCGYTAGVMGNTGEQFVLTMINGDDFQSIAYDGMYGVEQRVYAPLMKADYKYISTPSFYGRMKRQDVRYKYVLSETEAIKAVKEFIERQ